MDSNSKPGHAKFGSILGIAPGNVPSFSSDYDTVDETELPDRHSYRNYIDGIFMGHKWQCVEFVRRWLYLNNGHIIDEVAMAYEIFELSSIRDVRNNRRLPIFSFRNGSRRHPQPGCLLVWDEGGEFVRTGHVAIITEIHQHCVRVVEQNLNYQPWPESKNYSREIKATITDTGEFWLESSFGDATILGWMIQTDDNTDAVPISKVDPLLYRTVTREVKNRERGRRAWLNVANSDEAAYVKARKGHFLTSIPENQHRYWCISEIALEELEKATNQLHVLFMHATDYVMRDQSLLERFGIPRFLWPKIHQSWNNRRNEMITGRFDFSLTEQGLKVYEYNCDSSSSHMECGKIQGKWAQQFNCRIGYDPGAGLHEDLKGAWRRRKINGLLHILQDRNEDETYHALFMQEAMEEAGIRTKIIKGIEGLRWGGKGEILDREGEHIKWVWKTWAWETAIDQIRSECHNDENMLMNYIPGEHQTGAPRLVDVLLRSEVMVFEPLWTLIPSNKAILPVLWSLFPNHPYLLNTSFEVNDELRNKGYVEKPIVGRCGSNIRIFDEYDNLVEETTGNFEHRMQIFQEYFPLPECGGFHAQISTFSIAGMYSSSCIRVDKSRVITLDSDNLALRIVDDDQFRGLIETDIHKLGSAYEI